MAFGFGNISSKSSKKVLQLENINSILAKEKIKDNLQAVVLLSSYRTEKEIEAISKFLESRGLESYRLIFSLKYKISSEKIKEDLKEGITTFFKANKSRFEEYIPAGIPVIAEAAAVYALTGESDVNYSQCTQRIFGKSNFWFSKNLNSEGNWVYPIAPFEEIFLRGFDKKPSDSYNTKLAALQIKDILAQPKARPRYPKLIKHFISSKEEFINDFYLPNKSRKGEILSWDTETDGFDFLDGKLGCITLSFDGIEGWYIPWKYVDTEKLGEIFKNNCQLLANGSFDLKWLWARGVPEAKIDEDIVTLGHTLDETRSATQGNSLKTLAYFYSEFGGYERALDEYKESHEVESYLEIPEEILKDYAIMDAIVCRRIFGNMIKHLRYLDNKYPNEKFPENTLEKYYKEIRIPAENMYAKLEYRGVYVDVEKLDKVREEINEYAQELTNKLCEDFEVPKTFNWKSSKEVGNLLEKKGWSSKESSKSGGLSTDDHQLAVWAKTHPEIKNLQKLRSTLVLTNTWVGDGTPNKGWPQYFKKHPDGSVRMHPSFGSMKTDSGRTLCKRPNLQNTPTRNYGLAKNFPKMIKSCISTPDNDNYYLVTVDYAALEARLASLDSEDPVLLETFNEENADFHSRTSWVTFFKDKETEVEEIEVECNGKIYKYLGGELVNTQRGFIPAQDLTEEDTIVE